MILCRLLCQFLLFQISVKIVTPGIVITWFLKLWIFLCTSSPAQLKFTASSFHARFFNSRFLCCMFVVSHRIDVSLYFAMRLAVWSFDHSILDIVNGSAYFQRALSTLKLIESHFLIDTVWRAHLRAGLDTLARRDGNRIFHVLFSQVYRLDRKRENLSRADLESISLKWTRDMRIQGCSCQQENHSSDIITVYVKQIKFYLISSINTDSISLWW